MKGLYNVGNNCYINSVIQSAITTNGINEAILQAINTDKERVQSDPIVWGYCQLVSDYLKQSRNNRQPVVDNRDLINHIWRAEQRWREQNDSSEFLTWFVDRMKACGVADPLSGKDLITSTLSCGHPCTAQQEIECRCIQITSQDIATLDVHSDPVQAIVSQQSQLNDYVCDTCKQQVKHKQTRTPLNLAQVLLIQIVSVGDLHKPISTQLSLADGTMRCNYRLAAIYVYHGNALNGHYSCIAFNWKDGKHRTAFHCDDMSVRVVNTDQLNQLMPFARALVYDRVGSQPLQQNPQQ